MQTRHTRLLALLALLGLATGCARQRAPITTGARLARLAHPAGFAEPGTGASHMISTYDRSGGNADWWTFPEPLDGKELYEAAALEGPGCVTRIWMTNVPATEWLFYFDGEENPSLKYLQSELFGATAKEYPLNGGSSGGAFCYMPFPYEKSLRVVLRIPERKPDNRPYFHINYETYPAGTKVRGRNRQNEEATAEAFARTARAWETFADKAAAISAGLNWRKRLITPGEAAEILAHQGAGTVETLAIRISDAYSPRGRSLLLRALTLEARWDGSPHHSIRVPLGDFYCNGLHPREFAAMPLANIQGAMISRFPMPFRKEALITLRNETPYPAEIEYATEIDTAPPRDTLYLHASFAQAKANGQPFEIMRATGEGKYVGCYLISMSDKPDWNILEGDEYFFRDGGRSPIQHGTGLEDYFNGGWYYFGLFERPLHGLLEKAAMRTAQYRFHLADPVTYGRSLRMLIEFGHGNQASGYMSAVAFRYETKPASAGYALPPLNQRFPAIGQLWAAAIPCELFELERMGLLDDALERCLLYAEELAPDPVAAIFDLRALAYREMLEGHAAVRDSYLALATSEDTETEVAEQARLLAWRGEKAGRAIFGAHAFGGCELFVDGKLIGATSDPNSWRAFAVELAPGAHLLEAVVRPHHDASFLSAAYSSFFTNIVSDTSWDYCEADESGQPAGNWKPFPRTPGIFPTMAWWYFRPNAFPCVQSDSQQCAPEDGWHKPAGRVWRFRRRFEVPAEHADRPPLPPRRYGLVRPAVRPADDTSNE